MGYPYKLLDNKQSVNIESWTYLHWNNNPHIGPYRINEKQWHYSTLLQPPKIGHTAVYFPMGSEHLTRISLTKAPPLGYITDWSSVPSVCILYIDAAIYWILVPGTALHTWPAGARILLATGSLTHGLSLLLGTISLTNTSYSEDWGPLIYDGSGTLTLPATQYLILKHVDCSLAFNRS